MASLLDGPGQLKMATLDQGVTALQRLHSIVERFAVAVRTQQDTGGYRLQLSRAATPMVGLLKPQFGPIADLITGLLQVSSRGGGEQVKVRALREFVAQIRMQLEISANKVKEKHTLQRDAAVDRS